MYRCPEEEIEALIIIGEMRRRRDLVNSRAVLFREMGITLVVVKNEEMLQVWKEAERLAIEQMRAEGG